MSTYLATIRWTKDDGDFLKGRYSRQHSIAFDGGIEIAGSSSAHTVPLPYSVEAAVDPEELFVASISTCHMLWFLDFAKRAGIVVEAYEDAAEGAMEPDDLGRLVIAVVTLRPLVKLANPGQSGQLDHLHHQAHRACFIANSVKSDVRIKPR
ncbi:MAG TPA: OsmC family protein [Caulobacteraceae bacterium]|nr:OsmC family protein [Caulobacteraceae bacterium]